MKNNIQEFNMGMIKNIKRKIHIYHYIQLDKDHYDDYIKTMTDCKYCFNEHFKIKTNVYT
jgi:hypothetical protein